MGVLLALLLLLLPLLPSSFSCLTQECQPARVDNGSAAVRPAGPDGFVPPQGLGMMVAMLWRDAVCVCVGANQPTN